VSSAVDGVVDVAMLEAQRPASRGRATLLRKCPEICPAASRCI
jgi:hypothetical protein